MTQLQYDRKLTEDWVFDDLVVLDRKGNPQSILGVNDFAATLQKFDGTIMWTADTSGCTVQEVDGNTVGYLKYVRAKTNLGTVTKGRYRLDFVATIGGRPTAVPEGGYIIVEVI